MELSEEEKSAVEIVKNITEDDLLDCWDYGEKEFKALQIILNLIEKQQKEIESNKQMIDELNFRYNIEHSSNLSKKELIDQQQKEVERFKIALNLKCDTLQNENMPKNIEMILMYKNDFDREFGNDYISKDKIRAKIEEIEKRRIEDGECELALHSFQREAKIEVLQSLLEENNNEIREIPISENYISKDKIRELQDKYKNKIERLESKKVWNEPIDTINKNRYTNYFNAYEELLQEGDK